MSQDMSRADESRLAMSEDIDRTDESRLVNKRDPIRIDSFEVEQPDPENPGRMSIHTHHAVIYLLTDEGYVIDPDQTITAEVDTTPNPEEPEEPNPAPTEPPVNVDVPAVSGPDGFAEATVGQTLTCTTGNWQNEPDFFEYAWHTDDVPNSAVGETYNIPPGDAGHSITCVVTASNAIGSTTAPPSNAIPVV